MRQLSIDELSHVYLGEFLSRSVGLVTGIAIVGSIAIQSDKDRTANPQPISLIYKLLYS